MEQQFIDNLAAAREKVKQHPELRGFPETLDAHIHLTRALTAYVCHHDTLTEEIAQPLIDEFVPSAKFLCGYEHLENDMYPILASMNAGLRAFPRVQYPVLCLLCENLSAIENSCHHSLSIADDAYDEKRRVYKLINPE